MVPTKTLYRQNEELQISKKEVQYIWALLGVFKHHRLVAALDCLTLENGDRQFAPETSLINYWSTQRKIPDEIRFHLHCSPGLKSRKVAKVITDLALQLTVVTTDFSLYDFYPKPGIITDPVFKRTPGIVIKNPLWVMRHLLQHSKHLQCISYDTPKKQELHIGTEKSGGYLWGRQSNSLSPCLLLLQNLW